jgi:hypothetical protein
MFDEIMINGNEMFPDDDGYSSIRFDLRLPWYRGLTLSCVTSLEVTLDGEAVKPGDLSLTLNGLKHSLEELKGLTEVFWSQRRTAKIHVRTPGGLKPGPHDLKVALFLNIPYIRELEFPQVAECAKRLTLVDKDY